MEHPDPASNQSAKPVCIAVCTVKSPDDGQRNCPKHVEFYSKNKFEEFVCASSFIHRLTKIIRSGITFISPNTHTDGKDKPLGRPDRSCLLLYVSARIH